jgi:hypothetical protein
LYRSTKTRAAVAEAANRLGLDPRTIYGWYVEDQFRDWLNSGFRAYHEGMAELFTTKLYKCAQEPYAKSKDIQTALGAALKLSASLVKAPASKEDAGDVFKKLLKETKSG